MLKDLAMLLNVTDTEHIFKWLFDVSAHLFVIVFFMFTAKRIIYTATDCWAKIRGKA